MADGESGVHVPWSDRVRRKQGTRRLDAIAYDVPLSYATETPSKKGKVKVYDSFLYAHLTREARRGKWYVMRHRKSGWLDCYSLACAACCAELHIGCPNIGKGGVVDFDQVQHVQNRLIEFLWGNAKELPDHVQEAIQKECCTIERLIPGSVVQGRPCPGNSWSACSSSPQWT